MNIVVRFSTGLAQQVGRSRVGVTLTEEANVAELLEALRRQFPDIEERLEAAVPVVSGQHVTVDEPLTAGQEVALLLPIAGG